ncbi:MAG TPA: type II CAAX endopeptidase family protein [Steroidobacteraceae bacterium]|nr:type II CAAX endopeptidase family protein [Steroidobacteraceae bacterium]
MLRAIGLTILLFVAVYAPASTLAAGLHLQLATTVPFVMFLTLITAGVGIRVLAVRTPGGLVRYGFSVPALRYVVAAVLVGAPVAIFVALLLARAHEAGPLAGLSLAPWMVVLYFVVGAPIQEEVIFRGLLQTTLAIGAAPPTAPSPKHEIAASLLVALLFGCIHFVVGRYTAAAAFILGAIAGEFRRRSGSLIPAVLCHAFFNLAGIIWP